MSPSDDESQSVGSLGEEAVKLLQALQGWARESADEHADTVAGAAGGAASLMHEVNEHIATGSSECKYCPLCQAISAARSLSPEVKEHLSSAASSLLQAAAGMLATDVPQRGAPSSGESPVEKIDLSDDAEWEDD